MTRRARKRELMALGAPLYTPTEEQRYQVRMFLLNNVPERRIAEIMEISLDELKYHYRKELGTSNEVMLAWAADNMVQLAKQNLDLGVKFKATALMLQSRKSAWRVPREDKPDNDGLKPVERLTLAETEAEIARILERRGSATGPAATAADPDAGEDEP